MMRRRGGLIRGVARTAVVAGTATAVSNRVSRRQAGRWDEQQAQDYEQQAQEPQYAAPPPPPPETSDVDELQQIAQLHQQGILTDEEFAAKKAQILGI